MKIFDTHAHYTDQKYDEDRENLFKTMKESCVDRIVLIGANLPESKAEGELARKYNIDGKGRPDKLSENTPTFYYTVGDHPDEILNEKPDSDLGIKHLQELEETCRGKDGNIEAIAIGEIGLDYYGEHKTDETYKHQADWCIAELNLARKLSLPVVIHSRDACQDTYDMIKNHARDLTGIIHCFGYEKEVAFNYIDMGYYIGVGGVLTFKNGRKLKEVVESIPLEWIVTETDCPWLAPTPHRGERNESTYIRFVIEEIAKIKNMDIETVSNKLYENAIKVYNLH